MLRSVCVRTALWALFACSVLFVARGTVIAQDAAPELTKAPPAAVALYAEAANLQNNGEFELAAEIWEQYLTKHPATELTPKAQYYAGVCYLAKENFTKATPHFQAVTTKWAKVPDLNLLEDAFLNLGWCQFQSAKKAGDEAAKLYDQAAATFSQSLKQFPKGKYADQSLYFLGESLYLQGKATESIAAYSRLADEHPKSKLRPDGLYALGVALEESKQFPQAGATYDNFIGEFANDGRIHEVQMRKAETILQAGLAAQNAGKAAEAKPLLEDAQKRFAEVVTVEGFPMVDHALYRQAVCLVSLSKYVEGAQLFAKIATEHANSAYAKDATLDAGRFFYRAEQYDQAAPWLDKVAQGTGPGAAEAAHWLCRIHLRNKEPQKAVDLAGKVLPNAGNSEYLVYLKMDQADGKYEIPQQKAEAIDFYLKIAEDHPQHEQAPQALYNAAYGAMELKKYDNALAHVTKFVEAFPNHKLSADAKFVAAECNLLLSKYAEAEAAYRDLIANHAGHADFEKWQVRLGFCAYLQEKYDDTIAALSPIVANLKDAANIAEAQFLIGASHFNNKKYAEANQALSASLAADPKWSKADEVLLLLAQTQHELKQTNEAIATIKKLLAEHPNSRLSDQAHYRHAEFAFAADDFKTAIAEYTAVIDGSPNSTYVPYAYYGKGWSLMKSNDYATAAETFTAMLDKHAQHTLAADTYFARGMSRRQTKDNEGAIADINEFLKSNPQPQDKCNALFERGMAESALKDNAGAAKSFSELLQVDPKCPVAANARYELAWALKLDGKEAPALAEFNKITAEHPDSEFAAEANFHVADDLYAKGKYDEAAKGFTLAKQKAKDPSLLEKATYKLGWSNYQLKQFDESLKQFRDQVTKHPQGELKADGLFMVAESLFELKNYEEALPAYNAARTAAEANDKTSDDVKVLILLHGGQSAAKLNKWDEAFAFLQTIPTQYDKSPFVAEAMFEIGRAQHGLDKNDEALPQFEAAYVKAAAAGNQGLAARCRYMVGEVHFAKKEYDEAIKQFKRVIAGFANPTEEVKTWQAYSGYEAGRCAQVQISSTTDASKRATLIKDAIDFYTYVVEKHPDSSLAATAKKQLTTLQGLR